MHKTLGVNSEDRFATKTDQTHEVSVRRVPLGVNSKDRLRQKLYLRQKPTALHCSAADSAVSTLLQISRAKTLGMLRP